MTPWKHHRDTIVSSERFIELSMTGSINEAIGAVTSALMYQNQQKTDQFKIKMPTDNEIRKEVMAIRDEPEPVCRGSQIELF
jgi:hypothetical protein